jgi:uncharacterized protein
MSPADAPFELERFEYVLLRRPDSAPALADDELERLQREHLAYLGEMRVAHHLVVAGPFDEQFDESHRGMALYHTGSIETTRTLAEADPAVVAGRLAIDVMYVYLDKGAIRIPWLDQ